MTSKQSTARLLLYSVISFLTPLGANWAQMENATAYQWGGMLLQAAITAAIAARAYIDTSESQVEKP